MCVGRQRRPLQSYERRRHFFGTGICTRSHSHEVNIKVQGAHVFLNLDRSKTASLHMRGARLWRRGEDWAFLVRLGKTKHDLRFSPSYTKYVATLGVPAAAYIHVSGEYVPLSHPENKSDYCCTPRSKTFNSPSRAWK